MDQQADEKLDVYPFWFDANKVPTCPNYVWARPPSECYTSGCPYSHDLIVYFCMLPVTASVLRDFELLFAYVIEQVKAIPEEQLQRVEALEEQVSVHDMEQLSELMEEMRSFETGELGGDVQLCPQLQETGNCLLGADCTFPHEPLNSEEVQRKEKAQEWYPGSKDCECCQGYKFGCEKEECRVNGCVAC